MYQIGDKVLYGIHGVCTISAIESKRVDRKTVEYYVLEPQEKTGAAFYVPTGNPIACAKLKPILTREELDALLQSEAVCADAWIEDENLRKNRYRELIVSGDRVALLAMIRTLSRRREALLAAGKKFHLCDENFLRDAEKVISGEFSHVLQLPQEQVPGYIMQKMKER